MNPSPTLASPPMQGAETAAAADLTARLTFFKHLQAVTNKIHATSNIDEIMLELSQDITALFNAERLTIYAVSEDKTAIVSKVKTGLDSFREIRLPIAENSIAGFVAATKRLVNIRDVYDDMELLAIHPSLHFLKEVDKRTGYRTREMLVGPIVDAASGELLGVVQLINNKSGTPFSHVMEEGLKGLCETLAIAFAQRVRPLRTLRSKYDYLVSDAVLTQKELEEACKRARRQNVDVEEVLLSEFQLKTEQVGAALAKFFGVPYEPFRADRIKPHDLLKNLRREFVAQNRWLPIEADKDGIVILCVDPEQVKSSRVANTVFPRSKLSYRVTTQREFKQTLDQFYGGGFIEGGSVGDLVSALDEGEEAADETDEATAASDNELVRLVNKIIFDAYREGASDIHIEPGTGKEKVLVRFRKDGLLSKYVEIPSAYRNALVARIKIMCDLDISEKRLPQDGKIKFKRFAPLDIELRVATIPTAGGVEDVVMRILSAGEPMPLDRLGLLPHNETKLKQTIEKPYGLFFVCGPTGSGKTTTLHSVLKYLNTPDTKIWTVEDPVEITQKGLRQVQVNRKAGLDFATVMRAFLRADPDIIMVGEMRDAETTKIGIEASLTGHLVLATLHTNSAPESVVRLLDMGMDPFNFADALLGVMAQRLARRLCDKCKQAYHPSAEEIKLLLAEYCEELANTEAFRREGKAAYEAIYREWVKKYAQEKGQFTLYRAHVANEEAREKCEACGGLGYKGRIGLHELMLGTDAVKRLIQEHAPVAKLLAQALEDGMRTLKQDGIEKVLMGLTDLKQVHAVCIK
ncbi:MAG: GspE/PulE family protein [Rhodocyclaceae bacterium]|nr:GspE/PulE family protein [Rhodocyclaceae bacterium]